MSGKTARLAAWGVLVGLIAAGIGFVVANYGNAPAHESVERVTRNVKITAEPGSIVTGATTSVAIIASDGGGAPISAWEGAVLDAWLVRADLAYAAHVRVPGSDATSSFVAGLRPTQPGSYKLVAGGVSASAITVGGTTIRVTGKAEDVAPAEQSAGREGFKVLMSSIPDEGALRAGEPVSVTYNVSRTGTPAIIDEQDGARGSIVAFHEKGSLFLRGEASPVAYLPAPSIAAFSLTFPEPGRYRVFFEFSTGGREYLEARWIEVGAAR